MTVEQGLDLHDRQIKAIRELVHESMRLVVQSRKDIRTLAVAQRRTEESLKTLVDSLRRGGNGRQKKKLDIQ